MSTHCNFAVIEPNSDGTLFHVAIVRGVMASGNDGTVEFDYIARDLALEDAVRAAIAAKHIYQLAFYEYAPNRSAS